MVLVAAGVVFYAAARRAALAEEPSEARPELALVPPSFDASPSPDARGGSRLAS